MALMQGHLVSEKIIPPALDLELTIRGDVVLARLVRMYQMALINWRENTAVQIDVVDNEVLLWLYASFWDLTLTYARCVTWTSEYEPQRFLKMAITW